MEKNKFCEKKVLRNESDVEHFFVDRLLIDLGYKDTNILTKTVIPKHSIGKGNNRKEHRPDYALKIGKLWRSIIEVKHPEKNLDSYNHEAQDYAVIHNRGYVGEDPIHYVLTTNGLKTNLLLLNQNKPVIELSFEDFVDGNEKYERLKQLYSYDALKQVKVDDSEIFEFRKPQIDELVGVFQQCHQIIWKKHKVPPKVAFYEFTKLLFIKLNEDKKVHAKIDQGLKVTKDDFFFSINQITQQEKHYDNPMNHKFTEYRDELNREVENKTKKRIFEQDERLKLSPSTIKEIVKLIENLDLKSVEDDLNGKVFETFLEATIRGKALGQFFTPRTVVKFMVRLANLQIKWDEKKEKYNPPLIIDGCCGSGGFLIFALSDLLGKAEKLPTDYEKMKNKIKNECLFGIDASEDKIVQVARMNMYIHGDGGSHIFNADTLDKELKVEKGTDPEIADEKKELLNLLSKMKFDVALTNPPFSMKYTLEDDDTRRILKKYVLAHPDGNDSLRIKPLKSNVMFVERYSDILEYGGKLITVIDESVLNADGSGDEYRSFRTWLRNTFFLEAIISLPKNTFVNADAGVKTSILYLIKKKPDERELQSKVFMAISKNVGHNDSGRATPELNDLPQILEQYKEFKKGNYV